MPAIDHVVLEVSDTAGSDLFHKTAFDLGDLIQVRKSQEASSGFRGFTLSLVVSQPSTVESLVSTALGAGARELKPARKSFWGYGGVVQAPDGTIWKIATSSKKDTGPTTRKVDDVVLLLGVADVKATKQFYVERGLAVRRRRRGGGLDIAGSSAEKSLITASWRRPYRPRPGRPSSFRTASPSTGRRQRPAAIADRI